MYAFQVVSKILANLPEECLSELKGYVEPEEEFSKKKKTWQCKFKFISTWTNPDTSFLSEITSGSNVIDTFSMAYSEALDKNLAKKPNNVKKTVVIMMQYFENFL